MLDLILPLFVASGLLAAPPDPLDFEAKPVNRVAFGSCANHEKPQPIWEAVASWAPDVFVFLGDNVYGDTEDMEVLAAKYGQLAAKPGFQALKRKASVIGTWDDHDYGANDAGLEYPMKEASKEVFLDFFEEPAGSERRNHEGIYTSYLLGPEGKRVQFIMIDARTFRTPLLKREIPEAYEKGFIGPYAPREDEESTMLGEAQWKWLEAQLKIPAEIRLIGMSTQFLQEFNGWEAWANMPRERQRFIDLIRSTRANGVIFISGDTHWAELSRDEEPDLYPLHDLTSSGLTEVWKGIAPNRNRVLAPFLGANFGTVEIEWDDHDRGPRIVLSIHDEEGQIVISQAIWLDELDFDLEPADPVAQRIYSWSSRGVLQATFDGDQFTGTFGGNDGKLSGVLKGRTVTGTWSTPVNQGPFEFTISRTGGFIHGRYGIQGQDGPDSMPWSWTASPKIW
tara:strand:- start:962 stop:2317 length:1356 start_codon:yes stop_codon:yes gene_type:complete